MQGDTSRPGRPGCRGGRQRLAKGSRRGIRRHRLEPQRPIAQDASHGRRAVSAVALLACASLPPAISAAEISFEPQARERIVYDTNRRLVIDDAKSTWGSITDVRGLFLYRTERLEVEVTPEASLKRFSAEKDLLDREDEKLSASLGWLTEHSSFDLDAQIENRGSQTTDLEALETTRVNVDTRDQELNATWSHQATERLGATLSGAYTDVDYSETRTNGLRDFSNASLSATGTYAVSARDSFSVTVFASRFDAPESLFERLDAVGSGSRTISESETKTLGLQVGYGRALSETLFASASVGPRRSDVSARTTFIPVAFGVPFPALGGTSEVDDTVYGLTVNAALEQDLETLSWSASFSRTLSPTADGREVERDALRLDARRNLSRRLSARVGLLYRKSVEIGDDTEDEDTFARLQAGVRWRLAEHWFVDGLVRLRRADRENADEVAESEAFQLTLSYRGGKWLL